MIQGNRLYKPCVYGETGLGRRRPKPPAGPPKFRYLHFTGLSGPKIRILHLSENADFKQIFSILLEADDGVTGMLIGRH